MEKKWTQSKAKWGAVLFTVSTVLGTAAMYLSGALDIGTAITAIIAEIGAGLSVWGVRDAQP